MALRHTLRSPIFSHITILANPFFKDSNLEQIHIQRHEHTHIIAPQYKRGDLENKTGGWQD
jgi:hypothetical protein